MFNQLSKKIPPMNARFVRQKRPAKCAEVFLAEITKGNGGKDRTFEQDYCEKKDFF